MFIKHEKLPLMTTGALMYHGVTSIYGAIDLFFHIDIIYFDP